jgi:hypothetical protein
MTDDDNSEKAEGNPARPLDDLQAFFQMKVAEAVRRREANQGKPAAYKARFCFRPGKHFQTTLSAVATTVLGQRTEITPEAGSGPISDAEKLIWTATGFVDEAAAVGFGVRLQRATAIAAARLRLGADVGYESLATLQVGDSLTDLAADEGIVVRTSTDGVMAYPDDGSVMMIMGTVTLSVTTSPEPLMTEVAHFAEDVLELEGRRLDALVLFNAALINPEPLARLALAVTAVEMLARDEKKWSVSQKRALKAIKAAAAKLEGLSFEERAEIEAAAKGMENFGINESCRRLIRKLGREDLLHLWRSLYGVRSQIFHGTAYPTREQIERASELGVVLSARIVLAAVAQVVPGAADDLDRNYPLPQ